MSARTVIVIVLALVFGLVAALLVHQMANKAPVPGPSDEVDVMVATRDISPGQEIVEGMFTTNKFPKDRLPPRAVLKKEKLLKRAALMQIFKDEPIVESRLTEEGKLGLAPLIKKGWRAYTVSVVDPASGVGTFLLPRSKVDVLLTLKGGGGDREGGPITTVLLQNVEVLAVGSKLSAGADQGNKKGGGDNQRTRNVTFAVKPEDANKLQLGTSLGNLHLVLRHPDDNEKVDVEEATLASIRQGGAFSGQAWEDEMRKNERAIDEKFNSLKQSLVEMIDERTKRGSSGVAAGGGDPNQIFIRTFNGNSTDYVGVIKPGAEAPAPKQD